MGKIWPLQDAKAKLSQLIRAAEKAPQTITRHGEEVGVLLSPEEYRRLTGKKSGKVKDLAEALRNCPTVPEFELPPRRHEAMRKIDFE